MADVVDKANDFNEHFLNLSLSKINTTKPVFTGICLACGEQCGTDRRYCDADCRIEHERQMRILKGK